MIAPWELIAAVGGGVAVLWAGLRFLFEPHVARIITRVIEAREVDGAKERARDAEEWARWQQRVTDLEESMANAETDRRLFAQTLTGIAKSVDENAKRQTAIIEKIADRQDETAKAVARIEGAMERRGGGSR